MRTEFPHIGFIFPNKGSFISEIAMKDMNMGDWTYNMLVDHLNGELGASERMGDLVHDFFSDFYSKGE